MKRSIDHKIRRARVFTKLLGEQWDGVVAAAACSFCINVLYALSNGVLGIVNRSLWFMAMCAYYVIFSTMRFSAVLCGRKHTADVDGTAYFVMRLSGGLLTLLSLVLTGIIYLSLTEHIATKYDTVVMITIATYTFYKIAMAIVHATKGRQNPSILRRTIRRIGYADVAVSVLTLQRSMFASFGEGSSTEAHTMNVLTGAAVCLFVCLLGITMIIQGKKRKEIQDEQIEDRSGE